MPKTMIKRQPRGVNRLHINLTDLQVGWLQEIADKKGVSYSVVIGLALGAYYTSENVRAEIESCDTPHPE